MGTNDASFNDGTGIGAVLGSSNFLTGVPVQVVKSQDGAVATGSTTLPRDDTIPQNTEGTQFLSVSITPKSATNNLVIHVVAHISSANATAALTAALFQDTTAGALAAINTTGSATGTAPTLMTFTHTMLSGTTSSTTFKVRVGDNAAGTVTFNGTGGSRLLGGVMASSIVIMEYKG